MSFFVRVPGSCGELAQGSIDGVRLHISCPMNRYSWASLKKEPQRKSVGPKVRKALHLAQASLSAVAHQNLLRKPDLESILKWILDLGGVGVNIAHSGSMIGMLFRPGTYDLKEVERLIWGLRRRSLPIHRLQLRGGGI